MARPAEQLKSIVGSGLLSFPVTHFTAEGALDPDPYRAHVTYLAQHKPAAFFAAGGTGEFFSLAPGEYEDVVAGAVEAAGGRIPVIAGAGHGTALAIEFARRAERAGADGILLLPPYLIQAEQEGLYRHVAAVCRAVGLGVVLYHRDNCLLEADTVRRLAEACPNLIGLKDGHGNVEHLTLITQKLGDRLVYIGGMPTAEVFATANHAIGITTYSSAIFNFLPEYALSFYAAVQEGDTDFTNRALQAFFAPYLAIRNRRRGYAVSIVKAGLRAVGRPAGPVRAPLTDLMAEEVELLAKLIDIVRTAPRLASGPAPTPDASPETPSLRSPQQQPLPRA
ncbi:MAG: 5-dehydro-4-deoxyglucarate dehydratase [Methylobacteriaceae bacterium]|nr:5-dehydro-4-deoxyglucarate dehydratase [Methylobacteriaceae bacterium]